MARALREWDLRKFVILKERSPKEPHSERVSSIRAARKTEALRRNQRVVSLCANRGNNQQCRAEIYCVWNEGDAGVWGNEGLDLGVLGWRVHALDAEVAALRNQIVERVHSALKARPELAVPLNERFERCWFVSSLVPLACHARDTIQQRPVRRGA